MLDRVCPSCAHSDVNIGGNGVGAPDTLRFTNILLPSTTDCIGTSSNNDGITTYCDSLHVICYKLPVNPKLNVLNDP